MLPLPFTVSAVILLVAISISKLQYQASQIAIAAHALLGPLETISLIYTLVTYLGKDYQNKVVVILFMVAISFIGMFNFFGFAIQTPFIVEDRQFLKWVRRRQQRLDVKINFYWFYLVTFFSLVTNFKLKYILFSSLFNFDCLKCKLQSVQKFKIFNVFSFLGLLPEIITLYCAIVTISAVDSTDSFFLVLLDAIIIFSLNVLFSVLAANKEKDFFKEELEGLSINQVYNVPEQSFQSSVAIGGNSSFGKTLEDIIELDEYAYRTTTRQAVANNRRQAIEKISECSQEQNTVKTSQRSEVQIVQNFKGEEIQECHNILMIDEVYGFEQSLNEPPQDLSEVEYIRQAAQPQKCLQIPKPKPKKSATEEATQQEEAQSQQKQQHLEKTERINLAEYLQRLQQSQKRHIVDLPKYDKVMTQTILPQRFLNKLHYSLIQELKTIPTEKKYIFEQRYHELTEQSSITEKKTVAQQRYDDAPAKDEDHHLKEFEEGIKRVITLHNFERKKISLENEENKILRYRHASTTGIRINQDHGEEPIRNKSKEKINIYENNPIHNRFTPHPINNQRSGTENLEFLYQQSDDRVKEWGSKLRTQTIPVRKFTNSPQKEQESQSKRLQKHYSSSAKKPRENYDGCIQQQLSKTLKQFKRSSPEIRPFFPTNNQQVLILEQHSIGDRVPRKPTQSVLRSRSQQSKSVENIRGVSFKGQRKKRSKKMSSFQKNLTGLDRKKMKSLEKIYLDKQIK